jgi:drug/metabolite transporter (DMT)-like permease
VVESDTPPMSVPAQQISARSPDRLTLIAFGAFILLAGGAPVAIRGTYEQLTPYWSATLRFGTAALIFWLLMLVRGIAVPRGRALLGALIFGALNVGAAFLFVYYGLTKVGASLASTVTATVPLLTLFFAAAHKIERLRRQGLLGGLLVLGGIAISVSSSLFSGSEASLVHILLILAGAACFAEAGIVIKLFPPCNAYATNAIAMSTGTLILATASLVLGESWVLPSLTSVWLFLLYLALGSVVAAGDGGPGHFPDRRSHHRHLFGRRGRGVARRLRRRPEAFGRTGRSNREGCSGPTGRALLHVKRRQLAGPCPEPGWGAASINHGAGIGEYDPESRALVHGAAK